MPKANALSTTQRRCVLTGIMAAPLLAVAPAVAAAHLDDAQLLHFCAEFNSTHATIKKIEAGPETEFGSPEDNQRQHSLDHFVIREEQLLDQISEISAHTHAGILAKAVVIRKYLPQYVDEYEADPESSQIRIVLSLMDDLLGSRSV